MLILISPPIIKEEVLKPTSQFLGAGEKSKQLSPLLAQLAAEYHCEFLDLAQFVEPGDADGVHLELETHPKVAELIFQKIIQFKKQT